MNKKLLLAGIVLVLSFCAAGAWAQKTSSLGYLKYTLDGKQYNYGNDDVNCYYKAGDVEEGGERRQYHETVGYVSTFAKGQEKLSFTINTEAGKKPVVSRYQYVSILNSTDQLPSVYLSIDREIGEDYTFYGSRDRNPGTFEVTKVEGDWIEGTFEVNIPNTYDDDAAPLKITNGSFRVKISDF